MDCAGIRTSDGLHGHKLCGRVEHSMDTRLRGTGAGSRFQNISDEENANSFMKQYGDFSFYSIEPSDRILVSTGGAFAIRDPESRNILVIGLNDGYGATVPAAVRPYLVDADPATQVFSTERDFALLVPDEDGNRLVPWGANIAPDHDVAKLRNVRSVYANGGAFAFIYGQRSANGEWLGAIGNPAFGGEVPASLHLPLYNDPPQSIYSTFDAFAVLTRSGKVHAWGNRANGGEISAAAKAMLDGMIVTRIVATMSAFCAIDDDYRLIAPWGNPAHGGTIPSDRFASIVDDDGVKSIVGARAAFCAITRRRGKAVSWGLAAQGGDMSERAKVFAAYGNIVMCKASSWAFCMVNARGDAEAWGATSHGGTLPDTASDTDMGVLMAESGAIPAIRAIFLEKMRKNVVDTDDDDAVEAAATHLASSMDRVGPTADIVDGIVTVHANDASFFLTSQDANGATKQVLAWGLAHGGGDLSPPVRDVLLDSRITAVSCTNGAYGVVANRGDTEGAVTVWGATLQQLDAGQIPRIPPTIAQKLSGGIAALYSIKRPPPLNPAAPSVRPSFAARHDDGSYVLWGGSVENEIIVPGEINPFSPGDWSARHRRRRYYYI
ncbi:hypothetical protein [Luteibacter yeojuensis]|uniref:Alpha-tubulin suppressor-like RCC1 family protein n=1 Tax=Luteibacter yeojuensis TaxID=345309 RepID=A0A7X5TP87_9GAMM|nr:hypothetical protein [Luteibacter yeojuensis]NID14538.1 hypothetical protein [Luteibacter yeojuensis]